jgi:hypothetical protein
MKLILLALLVVLIVTGFGFLLHILWIAAGVLMVVWLIGFLVHGADFTWFRVRK